MKESKQKHFINLFLGTGLYTLIGIIITPLITRIVDPVDYGELSLFILYGNIIYIILSLGQSQTYSRFYYVEEDAEYKKYILGMTAKYPIILSAIAAVLIFAYFLIVDRENFILPIFSIYIITFMINEFARMTLRLKLKTKLYSLNLNLQKILYVSIVLLAVNFSQINHLIILTLATTVAQVVVLIVAVFSERETWNLNTFLNNDIKTEFHGHASRKMVLKYGIPFVFAGLCNWVFTGADKMMIKMFSSGTELGIYASAFSIVGVFGIISATFGTIWGPIATEAYETDRENRSFFSKATDYMCVILFSAGVLVILFKGIIIYMLGEAYRDAVVLIPFLTMHPIMYTLSEITVYGINFAKKTSYHIWITLLCASINIVLNYFLIKEIGSLGAAVATGITYTVFFIIRTYFSLKYFKVGYSLHKIGIITALYYGLAICSSIDIPGYISVVIGIICIITIVKLYYSRVGELLSLGLKQIKSRNK